MPFLEVPSFQRLRVVFGAMYIVHVCIYVAMIQSVYITSMLYTDVQ